MSLKGFFIISEISCSRSPYGLLTALTSERIYVTKFINIYPVVTATKVSEIKKKLLKT